MQDYLNKALWATHASSSTRRMKWTLGILPVLFAVAAAAPSFRQGPDSIILKNMSQEPITIEATTPNFFGDVISVTPPDAESIELQHLNDDTRFYPDYGDKDPEDNDDHFIEGHSPRTRRQIDYNDLNYEMYLDTRKRRDADGEPFQIDLDTPSPGESSDSLTSDSATASDVQTARSPVSDPRSISTQITYVIISEDDSSSDDAVQTATDELHTDRGEYSTEVIDLAIPSSEQGTTDSDSSSSTDSFTERNRVLRAIANTVRAKRSRNAQRKTGSVDADVSSSSGAQLLTRKKRQIPYYRLPDFLNYRVGRSISKTDSDDTEPDDAHLSVDGTTDLKLIDRVVPLPEYSSEFSELTRPSSTYVDGKLQSYYLPERHKTKRSLSSENSTERSESESTTVPDLDVVTAFYPIGIDATKENLSLPEGNFLGPRIYAKGDLLKEEQPSVTGIAAPMEIKESVPVLNGSEMETVYSAPANNLNLPLIIPVVAPTSQPGEEPRIELSVPSGYVPYIIQLSPTNNKTSSMTDEQDQSQTSIPEGETKIETSTSSKPQVPSYLPFVPTIIVTPSTPTPTSGNDVSTQINVLPEEPILTSPEAVASQRSITPTPHSTTASLELTSNLPDGEKQKRADWKLLSSAPAGEVEQPRQQTATWEFASNAPSSSVEISQTTAGWRSVLVGNEELPQRQTARWQTISNAPEGEVQEATQERTVELESSSPAPTLEQTSRWESASFASTPVQQLPKIQTARWKSAPSGEDELPKQQKARWEPISNAPEGEFETSIKQGENVDVLSERSSPQNRSDSEMSDQGLSDRKNILRGGKRSQVIPILEKNSVMSSNGSFSYSFKSGNGIQVEESGYLKKEPVKEGSTDSGVAQAVQGSYSYTAPDGRIISVRYVADENGFRPQVEDLPK